MRLGSRGGPDHRTRAAGHGAADVNPPAGLLPSIPANVLAPDSAAHDVAHGVGILNAQLTRHGATVSKPGRGAKRKCTL